MMTNVEIKFNDLVKLRLSKEKADEKNNIYISNHVNEKSKYKSKKIRL
jgi:hypothetical protein